eukprot:scaffold9874_cov116-Isochrysis_galbana.AAC.9
METVPAAGGRRGFWLVSRACVAPLSTRAPTRCRAKGRVGKEPRGGPPTPLFGVCEARLQAPSATTAAVPQSGMRHGGWAARAPLQP